MIMYHGGAVEVASPDLTHSRKAVDFGSGFYTTPIHEQAVRWSEKQRRRFGRAVVSCFEFDESRTAGLKTLKFESYSNDWLDFIVKCRAEQDCSDWDIVIGGVANDRVFDTLEAYFDGLATKEQTIDKLRLQTPNLQYCFRTPAALEVLVFRSSEIV